MSGQYFFHYRTLCLADTSSYAGFFLAQNEAEVLLSRTGQGDREAGDNQKVVYSIQLRQDFQHRRYNKEGFGSRMYSRTVRKLAFPQAGTRSRTDGQTGRQ